MNALNKNRLKKEEKEQKKIAQQELLRQVDEWAKKYNIDMYSNLLWTVRQITEENGDAWGKERLTALFKRFCENYDKMREEYDFEDMYAERYKLKKLGVDVEELMKSEGMLQKNCQ